MLTEFEEEGSSRIGTEKIARSPAHNALVIPAPISGKGFQRTATLHLNNFGWMGRLPKASRDYLRGLGFRRDSRGIFGVVDQADKTPSVGVGRKADGGS